MEDAQVQDLTLCSSLDEATILRVLKNRFFTNQIYTYIKTILLAVNPFQDIPIYNEETQKLYHYSNFSQVPPHVFAIAEAAHAQLLETKKNQSILISGESGAGKTESFKYIVEYLAQPTKGKNSQKKINIDKQILQMSPILEAFGNAKTDLNQNSSRFGKFTEIWFSEDGHVEGAKIIDYLLEKSRLVKRAENERNYHIFYYLLSGASASEKEKYKLLDHFSKYNYLSSSNTLFSQDITGFNDVKTAFSSIGMSQDKQDSIFLLLSSILRLGNIEFQVLDSDPENTGSDKIIVKNVKDLEIIATILGLDFEQMHEGLTTKIIASQTRTSTFSSPLTLDQALNTRDTLVQFIYEKLFKFIVTQLNEVVSNGLIYPPGGYIGLLDIFGFEVFEKNDFEQFCINFANEKLQSFFNDYIFKFEQNDYLEEGITWKKIDFLTTGECLNLFTKKHTGLISLLEEESNFPGSTPKSLVQKFTSNSTGSQPNSCYVPIKTSLVSFGVIHYAGKVVYSGDEFLEKNRNMIRSDIFSIFSSSKNSFVKKLFSTEFPEHRLSSNIEISSNDPFFSKFKKKKPLLQVSNSKTLMKSKETLITQFKSSLEDLIKALVDTNPFFIRCIKPNEFQKPKMINEDHMLKQLRYLGVTETVKIRKAGYSMRVHFQEFLLRYRYLSPIKKPQAEGKNLCQLILSSCHFSKDIYQIGHSKIFIRDSGVIYLETCLRCIKIFFSLRIQRTFRKYLISKKERLKKQQELQRQEELKREQELKRQQELQKQQEIQKQKEIEALEQSQSQDDYNDLDDILSGYETVPSPKNLAPKNLPRGPPPQEKPVYDDIPISKTKLRKSPSLTEISRKLEQEPPMQFEKPKPKPKPIEQSKPIVNNPIYGQKAPKGKDEVEEPKQSVFKLFKAPSKDDLKKLDEKKREKSFDNLLKSDKTLKLVYKDGTSAKKETSSSKFEGYLKERQDPKIAEQKQIEDKARKTRFRRSQTLSDLRSLSNYQINSTIVNQVIIWIGEVLGEVLIEEDLLKLIRNGDILCRFYCTLKPGTKCPYLKKGDSFAIQKINFFLESCKQLGLKDRELFSMNDLESNNVNNVIRTFQSLSLKLKFNNYSGPLLQNGTEKTDFGSIKKPVSDAYEELVATEKAYISSLKIVISYLDTIRKKQLMTKIESQKLFSNIEEILSIHEILYQDLGKDGREKIGSIFLKMIHYFKIYSVYCANYPTALAFLSSKKENDHAKIFLNSFQSLDESQGLPIETFLMKPVQRICKYPLLLRQINTITPEDSSNKSDLILAIEKIEEVVETVNERRRHVENSERIMQIEKMLISNDLALLKPTRRFLLQGEVFKVFDGGKIRERELFLFNDLLILATPQGNKKEKFITKLAIDLANIEILSHTKGVEIDEQSQEKSELNAGIEKFNDNPKKGIEYLIQEEYIDGTPHSIAAFLFQTPELSKTKIGEYIGLGINEAVLVEYCGEQDFSGMRYDEALRAFLLTFRLPGEAQIIDRIVNNFAKRYCAQNPGIFPDDDLAYTLVFAMIMLNTAIHNPKVDRKMSLEDFISNFRNADTQGAINEKILEAMYKSIKEEKLEMGIDEDQTGRIPIVVKNFPTRMCYGEKSAQISISIPNPDPTIRIKLQGNGIECEPNIISFAESSKQTFTIFGNTLGRKSLSYAKMGKGARHYSKPPQATILVNLPALEYTFELEICSQGKPKEILLIGLKSDEERKKWVTAFESAIDQLKRDQQRFRSESSPDRLNQ